MSKKSTSSSLVEQFKTIKQDIHQLYEQKQKMLTQMNGMLDGFTVVDLNKGDK